MKHNEMHPTDDLLKPEVGRVYEGTVKSTSASGAVVEILPGTEGLCPISEVDDNAVSRTEDVVKRGERVQVKLIAIDNQGRLRLSRKAAMAEEAAPQPPKSYLFVDPVPDYRR